jgi:hypothetical protein
MATVSVFHNISRDASFGLNTVFRTGPSAPEGVRSVPLSDGRVTWKALSGGDERHELAWVFQYEAPATTIAKDDAAVAEDAFARFNGGSGREDARYFARKLRSLSVGDVIAIDGKRFYSCESAGWAARDLKELRILPAAEAERVVRARYEFRPAEELTVTVPLPD